MVKTVHLILGDRFVLGVGSSVAASTASVGDTGGNNSITLTEGQMPITIMI